MKNIKYILVFLSILSLELVSFLYPATTDSANLTLVKDTLQSSRLSFYGRVKSPTAVGTSIVYIYTVASDPKNSISTNNLAPGDAIVIGTGAYTVAAIIDADQFSITTSLAAGDADDTDPIYVRQKPQHVVTFTTASAVPNGFFQILVKGTGNDNIPDSDGFDFGSGTVDVTASPAAGYAFSNNAATVSGGTGCTAGYHCFEYHYSGNGASGTPMSFTIGNTNGTNTPLAPAPKSGHVVATADTYTVIVKNFVNLADPTGTPLDQTSASIAVIESVRVTATVDPSITFTIAGVASAQTVCGTGSTTDIDTTTGVNAPLAVPFGSLTLNTFKTAAHLFTVSTNATNGYAVTAVEDDQLGVGGGTTPFIIDTDCDTGTCTHTAEQDWGTATGNPGFGYSLGAGTGSTMEFSNANTFKTRQFAAVADAESPQRIMYSTGVSNSHTGYICYRISVDATQAAGDYENLVTYTATATF